MSAVDLTLSDEASQASIDAGAKVRLYELKDEHQDAVELRNDLHRRNFYLQEKLDDALDQLARHDAVASQKIRDLTYTEWKAAKDAAAPAAAAALAAAPAAAVEEAADEVAAVVDEAADEASDAHVPTVVVDASAVAAPAAAARPNPKPRRRRRRPLTLAYEQQRKRARAAVAAPLPEIDFHTTQQWLEQTRHRPPRAVDMIGFADQTLSRIYNNGTV